MNIYVSEAVISQIVFERFGLAHVSNMFWNPCPTFSVSRGSACCNAPYSCILLLCPSYASLALLPLLIFFS